jgi:hypothetical protein
MAEILLRAVARLAACLCDQFALLMARIGVANCRRGIRADDPIAMLLALALWLGRK